MSSEARILRMDDIQKLLSVSRATIYRWMEAGHFPKPFHLGPNAIAWRREVIEEWIRSRPKVPKLLAMPTVAPYIPRK